MQVEQEEKVYPSFPPPLDCREECHLKKKRAWSNDEYKLQLLGSDYWLHEHCGLLRPLTDWSQDSKTG